MPEVAYVCSMERQDIKITADAVLHFSAFLITEDSSQENFNQPHVTKYALNYILRVLKQNKNDADIQILYREVFWFIQEKYNK